MTLLPCPECGHSISDQAFSCPQCGKPIRPMPAVGYPYGYEYRSKTVLFGLPLVHIAYGVDPQTGRKRVAKGIIAIGDIAVGGIAFGGMALGGITFGGISVGVLALGGMAVGLVALGGMAIGVLLALGGGAVGYVALGGGACGYYAFGGGACGAHVIDGMHQDLEAVEFFRPWLGDWVGRLRG
jgi:hypothetical protein